MSLLAVLVCVLSLPAAVSSSAAAKDGPRGNKNQVKLSMPSSAAVDSPMGTHGVGTAADRLRRLQNISQTIEELLDGYDIRLRPQFGGNDSDTFYLFEPHVSQGYRLIANDTVRYQWNVQSYMPLLSIQQNLA